MKNFILDKFNALFAKLTLVYLPQPFAYYALVFQTKVNTFFNSNESEL